MRDKLLETAKLAEDLAKSCADLVQELRRISDSTKSPDLRRRIDLHIERCEEKMEVAFQQAKDCRAAADNLRKIIN